MRTITKEEIIYWKTLEETNVPGEYTINIPYDCLCKILIIGGGGDGSKYTWSAGGAIADEYAGGGAGAGITGIFQITSGSYQLVVGDKGQDTIFLNQVAGKGNNGITGVGNRIKGSPGVATITIGGLTSIINDDATTTEYNTAYGWTGDKIGYGGSSPNGIIRDGDGSGGTATYSDRTGKAGYAKIDIVSTSEDYSYIEKKKVTCASKIEDEYYLVKDFWNKRRF